MLKTTKRLMLVTLGSLCVILGVIGLAVPIMPTSPFLLVAAACYARSSDRLYNKLLANPLFGPMIREWREKGTVTRQVKWLSIGTIVISFTVSIVFFINHLVGRILMAFVGFVVILLLYRLPVSDRSET